MIEKFIEKVFTLILAPFNCIFMGILFSMLIFDVICPSDNYYIKKFGWVIFYIMLLIIFNITIFIAQKIDNFFIKKNISKKESEIKNKIDKFLTREK